jgi:sugar lactone lactonase YvrE
MSLLQNPKTRKRIHGRKREVLSFSFFLLLTAGLSLAGCPKPSSAFAPGVDASAPAPVIAGFSPTKASFGATLLIEGSHFGITAADNAVRLNGVEATVTSATATQLAVTVPKNKACSGNLTVTVGGKTATSAAPFDYVPTVTVSTFVGGERGFADGKRSIARFSRVKGLAIDAKGNLYVGDSDNNRIRKVTPEGEVSTFAGSAGKPDKGGFADGKGAAAQFDYPSGIAIDAAGNLYVADYHNNCIRKVTPEGEVSTLAGDVAGEKGFVDGPGSTAEFQWPNGIAIDAAGNLYVADMGNHRIRKVTPEGEVSTLAGSSDMTGFNGGFADGPGNTAQFDSPSDIAIDAAGNLYVADEDNGRIRKVTPEGEVSTFAGIPYKKSDEDFADSPESIVDNPRRIADGPGSVARFRGPSGITIDTAGNLYVTDYFYIRKVTPEGEVSTLAGSPYEQVDKPFADGPGGMARFNLPEGIAIDAEGNLYVADYLNFRIRKITLE